MYYAADSAQLGARYAAKFWELASMLHGSHDSGLHMVDMRRTLYAACWVSNSCWSAPHLVSGTFAWLPRH